MDETKSLSEVEDGDDPYCKKCGSCGEAGCCPPDKCVELPCLYGSSNLKAYKELEEENDRLRRLLDIETLRTYHGLSFLDPPSHHEEIPEDGTPWDCPACVERYIERAAKFLDGS